jgi:hypothetical protein
MKRARIVTYTVLAVGIFFVFSGESRADDAADRQAAAVEYEKAVPTSETIELALNAFARNPQANLSPEDVKVAVESIKASGDMEKVRLANIEAMAKSFTVEEIKAMQSFYGSPEGKSAQKKMTRYVQQFFPVMNAAIMKSIANIQIEETKGAEPTKDVTPEVP